MGLNPTIFSFKPANLQFLMLFYVQIENKSENSRISVILGNKQVQVKNLSLTFFFSVSKILVNI